MDWSNKRVIVFFFQLEISCHHYPKVLFLFLKNDVLPLVSPHNPSIFLSIPSDNNDSYFCLQASPSKASAT